MKLYHIPDAPHGQRWQPLKDKAQQLRREHGGDCEPVNVAEEGREQLADFLNKLEYYASAQPVEETPAPLTRDEILNSNTPEAQLAAKALMTPANDEPRRGTARTADEIVAFILDECEVYQCENIMAALGTRIAEYLREKRK